MFKYNLFLLFTWGLILPAALIRLCTGKDTTHSLKARFSLFQNQRPKNKIIWCHAASVGEFNTLEILIPEMKEKFSNYDILITVSNITAYKQAESWIDNQLYVAVAPLDFKTVLKRFIKTWAPIVLITMENELFPNRIMLAKKYNCKVIWVNARLSKKSMKFWQKNSTLTNHLIKNIDHVFAQDNIAFDRFHTLGFNRQNLTETENLKKFRSFPIAPIDDVKRVNDIFPYNKTICAASTHSGEDEILIAAFNEALIAEPQLKMIIVPRHPKRMSEITKLIEKQDLKYSIRSINNLPTKNDQIFLADTMGELTLWYSASATTFVAGSLLPIGGHTPFEPAAYGSAIIHGQHFSNFQKIYTELDQKEGAFIASSATEISSTWAQLRNDKKRLKTLNLAQDILFKTNYKIQIINTIIDKITNQITQ
ncbi:MAG: hypothetical protein OSB15_06955 [Amylibacter sp.]|nr:hypothetical protein [Amylibacter sp.]